MNWRERFFGQQTVQPVLATPANDDVGEQFVAPTYRAAQQVVHHTYHRVVHVDDAANIKAGVRPQDCLLASYYWCVTEMMEAAHIGAPELLQGADRDVAVCMAIAFSAPNPEYQRICTSLKPALRSQADEFRIRWHDARKLQKQLDKAQRDAVRHITRGGVDAAGRAQAIHLEPSLERAYEAGRRALRRGQPLAQEGTALHFLMPYSVLRARHVDAPICPNWARTPAFSSLSIQERKAISYMHRLLMNVSDRNVPQELTQMRPDIAEPIDAFVSLASEAMGQPIAPADLPYGPLPTLFAWKDSILDNVAAFLLLAEKERVD